ncbi:MAG: aminomethyltransferase [Rhodospirillaceae bacterium]|nr:MAG: aminomethyltransferase [Rhodospirillaceae bacterium]
MSTGPSFCILPQRGVLVVGGEERHSFLQGLISNSIAPVAAGGVVHAALLTPQGKFLHEFFVVAWGEQVVLEAEAERRADLHARLAYFRLRAKVTLAVAEAEDRVVAVVFGLGAAEALAVAAQAAQQVRPLAEGVAYRDPRLAEAGVRLIGSRSCLEETLSAAGCREAAPQAYDRWRLTLGLPDGSRDMVVERSGILECGFEELNGVDFNKGCYVGQEVITRSKYRGVLKKRLMPVAIDGPVPDPGTPLWLEEREAGEMRSAVEGIGLAVLWLDALAEAQRTARPIHTGSTRLTPRPPEWMILPSGP